MRCVLLMAVTVAFPGAAWANLAPRAQFTATPVQSTVLAPVMLDASASLDPDNGPMPLSFAWDFGDGATGSGVTAQHAYAAAGAYTVTLTVADGEDQALQSTQLVVLAPVTPARPYSSGSMAVARDGQALFAVNVDHGSITRVELPGLTASAPWMVCAHPRGVAVSGNGAVVAVSCEDDNTLVLLDAVDGMVLATVPVGHMPHGVVAHPDGSFWVACPGNGSVHVVDQTGAVLATENVGNNPHALAVTQDGAVVLVTHFLTRGSTGAVDVMDGVARTRLRTVDLAVDPGPDTPSSGGGYPNLLGVVAVDPAGGTAWVGGLKSNTARGRFNSGVDLVPSNRVRGVALPLELPGTTDLVSRRLDVNNGDSVTGIAFTPDGRFIFLAHKGLGAVSVHDVPVVAGHDPSDGSPPLLEARFDVGESPETLQVEGSRLYVHDVLAHRVSAWDITNPRQPVMVSAVETAPEVLPADVALGRRLFNSSKPPMMSLDGYIACASCHPGGGHDGRTWDFTQAGEGLRNTMDLRGHGRAPLGLLHWSANFDEVQDFENDIVLAFGGTGLAQDGQGPNPPLGTPNAGRSAQLDALAAYVTSLVTPPRSPWRGPDGYLTPSARLGRTVFEDPVVGCLSCHPRPNFTDSGRNAAGNARLHDINTQLPSSGQRLGMQLTGLDTPTLLGLWATPPYLHDGRAATFMDVFVPLNMDNWHGRTSDLAPSDLQNLMEYVMSLDGRPEDVPVEMDGGVPDASTPDAAMMMDAAMNDDGGTPPDANLPDAATPADAGRDAGQDAGRDAAVVVMMDAGGTTVDAGQQEPAPRCGCAQGNRAGTAWAAWMLLGWVLTRANRRR